MNIVLYTVGALALGFGLLISIVAKSAIHEIQAYIMFLIAAVLVIGGGIIGAIHDLHAQTIRNANPPAPPIPDEPELAPVVQAPRQVNPQAIGASK